MTPKPIRISEKMSKKLYLELLEESFPGIKRAIARSEALGFPWSPSKLFLTEGGGEALCHVACFECPILIKGAYHTMGALHAICTKASHRKQGLATHLIQEALDWAKERAEITFLFTKMPSFYERLSFQCVQEYRFHLPCTHPKGTEPLRPIIAPDDNELFLRCFREREPTSNRLWVKDTGAIAAFNTLFATYPTYWSLHYSPTIDGFISYVLEDKTLHLFDVVASKMPSLDVILSHLPSAIDEIYFYFSPDRFTDKAICEPYLHDKDHLMVHGLWPHVGPCMISPISRF